MAQNHSNEHPAAVPAVIDLQKIKEVIQNTPDVERVAHEHSWIISTTENSLTAPV